MQNDECDIAIIGAGVAGLYTAYRLSQKLETKLNNIKIFEASDRLGGRIETLKLGAFNAEAGSMRIEPNVQQLLNRLIDELNLKTYTTSENYGILKVPEEEKLFFLSAEEKQKTPLEILYLAISKILNTSVENLMNFERTDFIHIYTKAQYKDKYLWQMGWWEILSDVLSYEAIKYIMNHGHFYHFIHENLSAAAEIVFFIRVMKTNYRLKNIHGGMKALIDALEKHLLENNRFIQKNHRLINFEYRNNFIFLTFDNEKTIKTKKLILTIPLPNLVELKHCFPKKIQPCFSCANYMQLLKVMFVIKKPWWPSNYGANYQANKIPTRELHYYHADDGSGMIMIYADNPYTQYWRSLFSNAAQDKSRINCDEKLLNHFCRYFSCNPNNIASYAIRDWGKPPYHAALSFWKSNYNLAEVVELTRSFRLNDDANKPDHVYICGDTFTDYPGFIEGSLRSTDDVIDRIISS